jgi:hypothetical protein
VSAADITVIREALGTNALTSSVVTDAHAALSRLGERLGAMEAALERWPGHFSICRVAVGEDCTCGYDEARSVLAALATGGEDG